MSYVFKALVIFFKKLKFMKMEWSTLCFLFLNQVQIWIKKRLWNVYEFLGQMKIRSDWSEYILKHGGMLKWVSDRWKRHWHLEVREGDGPAAGVVCAGQQQGVVPLQAADVKAMVGGRGWSIDLTGVEDSLFRGVVEQRDGVHWEPPLTRRLIESVGQLHSGCQRLEKERKHKCDQSSCSFAAHCSLGFSPGEN